jgi:two-component system, chemotaxis family, chemotaxis protein CheY
MKAIVVDDSRATRTMLKRALAREGFDVLEAGDGREALEALTMRGPLDLALVDWNMPVMSGYELIREIRSCAALNRMAIMMVTTETEPAQMQKALDAGANEYVMKPFTEDILHEKLMLLGLARD